jgi:hypothetical protein
VRGGRARCDDRPTFPIDRTAERLSEVRDDRRHKLPPFWQGECEVVRQGSTYAANAVGKLNKVARGQNSFFQEIENKASTEGRTASIASRAKESRLR